LEGEKRTVSVRVFMLDENMPRVVSFFTSSVTAGERERE
jgi:hypothetical protein